MIASTSTQTASRLARAFALRGEESIATTAMERSPTFDKEVSGDHSGGETPVPIPNTAVKPASADGTALATGWESRSLPGISLLFSGL